jgi:hypothetical protein
VQNIRTYRSGKVTAADTNAHRLPDTPARLVVLKAPSTNAGTITVLGYDVSGATPAADSDGIILAAGDPPLTLWADNLNQLAYKASSASDVLEYLVGR